MLVVRGSERQVAWVHLRRHHRDQVVFADQRIERLDERLADPARPVAIDVVRVEEEHEDSAGGVGRRDRRRRRCSDGRRIGTSLGLRVLPAHALEAVDLLRHSLVFDLDFARLQIIDGPAADRRRHR